MEASQRSKKFNRIICSCLLFLQFMILNFNDHLPINIHSYTHMYQQTYMRFYKKHQREQLVFLVKIPLKFYDLAPRNGYMSFQRHILCFLFNQIIFIICVSFTWGNVDYAEDICANEISRNSNCFFTCYFSRFSNQTK